MYFEVSDWNKDSNLFVQTLNHDPPIKPESQKECGKNKGNRNVTSGQSKDTQDGAADDDEDQKDDDEDDGHHGEDQPGEEHATVPNGCSPDEEDVDNEAENLKTNGHAQNGAIVLEIESNLLHLICSLANVVLST